MRNINFSERIFACILLILLLPLIVLIAVVILIVDGRPILFSSFRMKSVEQQFTLYKFRTMRPVSTDSGVSGKHKEGRITTTGKFLRKSRLDEIPQLINIIKGDMGFIGPRPPLQQYTKQFPELYQAVLLTKPGVTGLASLVYHRHEEKLLSRTVSATEADEMYIKYCIPRKAQLDLIYNKNKTFCFGFVIFIQTIRRVLLR